jgi:hypothetical protein
MEGDKNYYLTLPETEGINQIKEDMSKDVATRLNGYLLSASENQTIPYRIYVDEIPFTVNQINPEDIKVNESEDGMTFSVRMHVKTSYKDMRYENTPTINVELPTRIIDMYQRAKKFDNEYETNIQWATTIALYMRAYVNGYNPEYDGSFLREGHIAYDPIDTLLRADLKAFKNLSIDSITGIGSVPLTTWLTETDALGEPSFLPPGIELSLEQPGIVKIVDMIKDGYDIEKAADCGSLSDPEEQRDCYDFNDPVKLRQKSANLSSEKKDLEELKDSIDDWIISHNELKGGFHTEGFPYLELPDFLKPGSLEFKTCDPVTILDEKFGWCYKLSDSCDHLDESVDLDWEISSCAWFTPKYEPVTCQNFRTSTFITLDRIREGLEKNRANNRIISPAKSYSTGTDLQGKIGDIEVLAGKIQNAVDNLTEMTSTGGRVSVLDNEICEPSVIGDCAQGKVETECGSKDSEDCHWDCTKCELPSYNKLTESEGPDYVCRLKEIEGNTRKEPVECKDKECDEECSETEEGEECTCTCEWGNPYKETAEIPQCHNQCYAKRELIYEVSTQINTIRSNLAASIAGLKIQIEQLNNRATTLQEAKNRLQEVDNMINKPSMDYDVYSSVEYRQVKYKDGTPTLDKCYNNPTWEVRNNGTCGDKTQSTGLYGAQISAAATCCSIFQGCCSTVDYSYKWFPAIYQITGEYTINEKLTDDKNRIMLHNIFAGDDDLYGLNVTPKLFQHVAPEFIIYKEHKITVKPVTADRILVYLYLPRMIESSGKLPDALKRVLTSFTDETCTKEACL